MEFSTLPWLRQLGCPALLHWQVILNFNKTPQNPTNPHLMDFAILIIPHRAGQEFFWPNVCISSSDLLLSPLSCSVLLSPHPVSHVCTKECFKAVLSFRRNLLCVHRLWRVFFSCYYLAKSNPFSTWIPKCRSPPLRPSPFQIEASKAPRH